MEIEPAWWQQELLLLVNWRLNHPVLTSAHCWRPAACFAFTCKQWARMYEILPDTPNSNLKQLISMHSVFVSQMYLVHRVKP